MSLGLIAPAYNEIVRAYKHFTLLNGSPMALEFLLDPTVTGVSLETWLGTPANLTQFQQLISAPLGAAAICASGTAMVAVAASTIAMSKVVASTIAVAAVLASSTARMAVYDSQVAWDAIVASITGRASLLSVSLEDMETGVTHTAPPGVITTTRVALIQQMSTSFYISHAGAGVDTYSTTSTTYIDRYVRVTGLTHRISNSDADSYIKYLIME